MSKVLFTISYDIQPEKREEYLAFVKELHSHLAETRGLDYAVFENKGKKNSFTEVFTCGSLDEYEQLEDNSDEKTQELLGRLDQFLLNGSTKYSTLVETT